MLTEILRAVAEHEPGLEVIEDPAAGTDLAVAVARAGADVVVVGGNCGDPEATQALLYAQPRVRVVTISGDGRLACHDALVPRRIVMHDVSPQGLLEAIQGFPGEDPHRSPASSTS